MIIAPAAIGLFTLAGFSALVAVVATVIGALFLGLFFSRGQPWGTRNDVASIVPAFLGWIGIAGLSASGRSQ